MDDIIRDFEQIDEVLKVKDSVREHLIKVSRDIIRKSGLAITYVHISKLDDAEKVLSEVRGIIEDLECRLDPHPELKYSNLYLSTLSEYVEAVEFLSIVKHKQLRTSTELKVHYLPYLQGLLDMIGELKRYILNLIRLDDMSSAWTYFNIANSIYERLKSLDYPEALLPGVRHRVDVARKLLEDLRKFLVDVESRNKLINILKKD